LTASNLPVTVTLFEVRSALTVSTPAYIFQIHQLIFSISNHELNESVQIDEDSVYEII
jgi:hypothetical protein